MKSRPLSTDLIKDIKWYRYSIASFWRLRYSAEIVSSESLIETKYHILKLIIFYETKSLIR